MKQIKKISIPIIGILLFVFVDQLTKILSFNNLYGGKDKIIIDGILRFHYLENRGAAFGIMQGGRWIFLILTILFTFVLTYEYFKIPKDKKYNFYRLMTIFLVSGAIGNAIDRVLFGYVKDFIYFELINFPIFYIADCYVTVSLFLLIIYALLPQRNKEDYVFFNGIFEFFDKKKIIKKDDKKE